MTNLKALALMPLFLGFLIYPAIPANAASATVMAYPTQNMAELIINDSVYAVFTYPNGSFISRALNGTSFRYAFSVMNIPKGSDFFQSLQEAIQAQGGNSQGENDPSTNISLINASVILSKSFQANETTAIYIKKSTLILWLSGVFTRNGSQIVGNFSWKDFKIEKHLFVEENGQLEDINFFGEDLMGVLDLGEWGFEVPQLSTINFSEFNQPLSQWNRTYNPATNSTIFTKTLSSQTLYFESLTINGRTYSFRIVSDPTYTISVQGYAVAQGNQLIVSRAPSPYPSYVIVYVAVVFIIVAAGASAFLIKRRR
ncbi:MAG: hypothetical protein ACP5LW_04625 [Nitrososphaeria archaeon]